jgi:hypothetical protein
MNILKEKYEIKFDENEEEINKDNIEVDELFTLELKTKVTNNHCS